MDRRRHRHVEAGSHRDTDAEAEPEIVMFLLGPEGTIVDPESHDVLRRTLTEVRRAWNAALEAERGELIVRDRLGPRPVQGTGRPAKAGYRDEIMVTARSRPERAVEAAVRSTQFPPPVGRLEVERSSITSRHYELAWDARIALWPWQHRRVQLRLYASPSLNVTVLALSPVKARAAARRRFLRVGNRVMNEVSHRLDDLVAQK